MSAFIEHDEVDCDLIAFGKVVAVGRMLNGDVDENGKPIPRGYSRVVVDDVHVPSQDLFFQTQREKTLGDIFLGTQISWPSLDVHLRQ